MSAVGDLVASFTIDTSQLPSAVNGAVAHVQRLKNSISGSDLADMWNKQREAVTAASPPLARVASAYHRLSSVAGEAGAAVSDMNSPLGQSVALMASSLNAVSLAVGTWKALTGAIEAATAAQVIFNAVSPLGWLLAIIAGLVTATYSVWRYTNATEAATEAQRKPNAERMQQSYEGKIPRIEPGYHTKSASELGGLKDQAVLQMQAAEAAAGEMEAKYVAAQQRMEAATYWQKNADIFGIFNAKEAAEADDALAEAAGASAIANNDLGAARQRLLMISQALTAAQQRESATKNENAVDSLVKQANEQYYAALSGPKNKADFAAWKVREMPGGTDTDAENIRNTVRMTEELQNQTKASETIEQLKDQVASAAGPAAELARELRKMSDTPGVQPETVNQVARLRRELNFQDAARQLREMGDDVYYLAAGYTDAERAAAKYRNKPGVTDTQINEMGRIGNLKADIERGKQLSDNYEDSPIEKFKKEAAELERLRSVLGPSFETTYQRGMGAIKEDYAKSTKQKERKDPELPKAMERGSAEAWKSIMSAMYGKEDDKEAAKETAANTKEMADALLEIKNQRIEQRVI